MSGITGTPTPERGTDEELRFIFVEVAKGRGNHGAFLRSFADALNRADFGHFALLRDAAWVLVDQFELRDYLP